MTSFSMQRRLKDTGITVSSLHPGVVSHFWLRRHVRLFVFHSLFVYVLPDQEWPMETYGRQQKPRAQPLFKDRTMWIVHQTHWDNETYIYWGVLEGGILKLNYSYACTGLHCLVLSLVTFLKFSPYNVATFPSIDSLAPYEWAVLHFPACV